MNSHIGCRSSKAKVTQVSAADVAEDILAGVAKPVPRNRRKG